MATFLNYVYNFIGGLVIGAVCGAVFGVLWGRKHPSTVEKVVSAAKNA